METFTKFFLITELHHSTLQRHVSKSEHANWNELHSYRDVSAPFSLISDTFYSKKKEMQWLFPYLPDLRYMHFEICNVQTICGNHHAESNLATHRSSLISQERGKRGQAQWFMAVMMHPGPEWLISAGNTFRSTSLTSEHPLPKHTTHTYSLAHVCGHFLGVRGERSYLLPGHILYVMTFCWCASVLVCRSLCECAHVDTTCRVLFYTLPPLKYLWLTHISDSWSETVFFYW